MANGNVTLWELSREELPVVIPSIVYLCLLMLVGLVGNVFVVIVFGFKLKKTSTYRHFILVLAVYDLMACCTGMPGLIIEIGRPYMFTNAIGCKILRYGYHVIGAGTSLTHALVGIDRYRRICKATGTQITVHNARSLSYCMLIIALLAAIPTIIINDIVPVETRVSNMTGHKCSVSIQYKNALFPQLYEATLTVLVVFIALTMTILYTRIGRRLCQRMEFLKSMKSDKGRPITSIDPGQSRGVHANMKSKHRFENRIAPWRPRTTELSEQESEVPSVVHDHDTLPVPNSVVSVDRELDRESERSRSAQFQRKKNRVNASRKVTVTTFAITAVYVGSFVPLQVLELVTVFDSDVTNHLTNTQRSFFNLGFLTYAIDNVANPIIYLIMDQDFRNGCKDLIRSVKCR